MDKPKTLTKEKVLKVLPKLMKNNHLRWPRLKFSMEEACYIHNLNKYFDYCDVGSILMHQSNTILGMQIIQAAERVIDASEVKDEKLSSTGLLKHYKVEEQYGFNVHKKFKR
jgi:hypothetical protein